MAVNFVRDVDDFVAIKRVLVSVSDKTGLDQFIPALANVLPGVHFYSTGGTYAHLQSILGERAAAHLSQVSDYTGQPETQGGLVKTLDYKIYLSLLTETYNESHQADLRRTGALPIDLVIVNLYPFEATIARSEVTVEQARANIDIGGPTMVRAAAKNYLRVAVVVDPADYPRLLGELRAGAGGLTLSQRFEYASKAFAHTAKYDAAIFGYLVRQDSRQVPQTYVLQNRPRPK